MANKAVTVSKSILSFIGLAGSAALFAFGVCKLLAHLFLAFWLVQSAGQSDIAARGVWLLGAMLPVLAVVSVATVGIVVLVFALLAGRGVGVRVVLGVAGAAGGSLLIVVGLDPTVLAVQMVSWSSPMAYYMASAGVGFAVGVMGLIATRHATEWPEEELAAA